MKSPSLFFVSRKVFFSFFFFLSLFFRLDAFPETDSLEDFLESHQVKIAEGYMIEDQKNQFSECLRSYPNIRKIMEIGLNAGHSALHFFNTCPHIELFVSFDINHHDYTQHAINYLSLKYQDRFLFVEGDSTLTIPKFSKQYPYEAFDLIYVDGCHLFDYALADIINAKKLAHPNTILWIDDFHDGDVNRAVMLLCSLNFIRLLNVHTSLDRCWVEARYAFEEGLPVVCRKPLWRNSR